MWISDFMGKRSSVEDASNTYTDNWRSGQDIIQCIRAAFAILRQDYANSRCSQHTAVHYSYTLFSAASLQQAYIRHITHNSRPNVWLVTCTECNNLAININCSKYCRTHICLSVRQFDQYLSLIY